MFKIAARLPVTHSYCCPVEKFKYLDRGEREFSLLTLVITPPFAANKRHHEAAIRGLPLVGRTCINALVHSRR